MKLHQRLKFAITSLWRVHFSLNSLVAFIVIAAVIYRFFLRDVIIAGNELVGSWYDQSSIWHPLLMGIVASVLAAIAFGMAGVFIFGWVNKTRLTGNYNAFALDNDDNWVSWGTVSVTYHPMSSTTHHVPVKLRLTHDEDDVELEGDGIVIDNRYLAGHYAEVGHPERRRSGSFIYEINGQGNEWQGSYVFVDPDISTPQEGKAKWVKR